MGRRIRQALVEKPRVHKFSYTQISTYLNCGRKYKFQYIDRIPKVGVNVFMILGKKVHYYIEQVLKARLRGRDLTKQQREKLREDIEHEMREEILDKARKYAAYLEEHADCLVRIEPDFVLDEIVRQFFAIVYHWDQELLPGIDPVSVEREIKDFEINGVPFIMYIDLIHNTEHGEEIVDWKIRKKMKGQHATDISLQLSIYALATGIRNVAYASLIRPAEGKEKKWKPRIELNHSTRTTGDVEWAGEIVKSAAESIRAGSFPVCSTENFLCNENFCDFWFICRGKHLQPKYEAPSWFDA